MTQKINKVICYEDKRFLSDRDVDSSFAAIIERVHDEEINEENGDIIYENDSIYCLLKIRSEGETISISKAFFKDDIGLDKSYEDYSKKLSMIIESLTLFKRNFDAEWNNFKKKE